MSCAVSIPHCRTCVRVDASRRLNRWTAASESCKDKRAGACPPGRYAADTFTLRDISPSASRHAQPRSNSWGSSVCFLCGLCERIDQNYLLTWCSCIVAFVVQPTRSVTEPALGPTAFRHNPRSTSRRGISIAQNVAVDHIPWGSPPATSGFDHRTASARRTDFDHP